MDGAYKVGETLFSRGRFRFSRSEELGHDLQISLSLICQKSTLISRALFIQ